MFRILLCGVSAALLVACVGCGTKLQKAGGKILVDGKPVSEGTVMFCPVQSGRPATARIMEDGSFTLAFEKPGDGLPPGDYKVVIVADVWQESKIKTKAQEYEEMMMKKNNVVGDPGTLAGGRLIHVVPAVYNDVSTTPLTQKVESSSSAQYFEYNIPNKKK